MLENNSVFEKLYAIDATDKVKQKNGLSYISWASAWAEVKKIFPDVSFDVYPQVLDDYGNTRFWHDDGHTGWVDVGVTINGWEERITLPIMDFKNKAIPADQITSMDANKAQMRCLVKALALHGFSMHIFEGEDLPEAVSAANDLKESIESLIKKKCAVSDEKKKEAVLAKVTDILKEAKHKAWPELDEDALNGCNYKDIEDINILSNLEKQLLAIRK